MDQPLVEPFGLRYLLRFVRVDHNADVKIPVSRMRPAAKSGLVLVKRPQIAGEKRERRCFTLPNLLRIRSVAIPLGHENIWICPYAGYDILLTPTMCTPPHKLGQVSMIEHRYRSISPHAGRRCCLYPVVQRLWQPGHVGAASLVSRRASSGGAVCGAVWR
jgi:hypothetical protein